MLPELPFLKPKWIVLVVCLWCFLFPIVPLGACGLLQASWALAVLILLFQQRLKPHLIFLSSMILYLAVNSRAAQYIEMIKIAMVGNN